MAIYKIEADHPAIVTDTWYVEAQSLQAAIEAVQLRDDLAMPPHILNEIDEVSSEEEIQEAACHEVTEVPKGITPYEVPIR